jgi:hypothetical protein
VDIDSDFSTVVENKSYKTTHTGMAINNGSLLTFRTTGHWALHSLNCSDVYANFHSNLTITLAFLGRGTGVHTLSIRQSSVILVNSARHG